MRSSGAYMIRTRYVRHDSRRDHQRLRARTPRGADPRIDAARATHIHDFQAEPRR